MKPLTAAAVLLALMGSGADAENGRSGRWIRDPVVQKRVNCAIDTGVAYLRGIQMSDGRWTYHDKPVANTPGRLRTPQPLPPSPGRGRIAGNTTQERDAGLTALALYALAASGVPKSDPAIRKGLEWIASHPRDYDSAGTFGTYSASLLVLALTRLDPVEHGPAIRILADRIAKAQSDAGMWSYKLRPARKHAYARADGGGKNAGDNSNSQFAVLALWAAHSLAGHQAPRATWLRIERLYRHAQLRDGAWPYRPPPATAELASPAQHGSVTMAAAGLVSYVYACAAIDGSETALHQARNSTTASAGLRAFSRQAEDPDWTNLYLVYSIERVGTVLGLRDLRWYETGVGQLCDTQRKDGAWEDPGHFGDGRHAYATSFALLFLDRATLPPRMTATTPADRVDVLTPKERRPMMQTAASHQQAFEIYVTMPRDVRGTDAAALGARGKEFVDVVLLALATDGRADAREAAHELIETLLGKRLLYDARAPDRDRAIMTNLIVDTWKCMRPTAVWDSRARQYVAP